MPDNLAAKARPELEAVIEEITDHLNDNRRGERLRNGVQIAVIGAPNAGKSSLVNALAQKEAAIVSEFAGTTRDIIEVHLDLGGYPVIVADTAGLRPAELGNQGQDVIEQEGIRRALKKANEADIQLLLFDGQNLPNLDSHTLELRGQNSLIAINKIDLNSNDIPEDIADEAILISAKTGAGLNVMTGALVEKVSKLLGSREAPSLTRARHRKSLENCKEALERSLIAQMPELATEDVRLAVRELGKITGRIDVEELLDIIFRDFCIGK